jgi:hypothetical protein
MTAYYRTPSIAHTRCHRCSDTIPKGEPMAFRSAKYERDRRIYCEDCAAELGIDAVDSKRMLASRQLTLGGV